MARMVRKQVYIDAEHDLMLKQQVAQTGRTESQLIRDAIELLYDSEAARARRMKAAEDMIAIAESMAGVAEANGIIGPAWPGRAAHYEPPRGMPKSK
ncbi:MAG: hypothetical protein EG823_08660 [Actinobacteria bacterium]|nr:hypothetical protein [Actinomycetota bacterium]